MMCQVHCSQSHVAYAAPGLLLHVRTCIVVDRVSSTRSMYTIREQVMRGRRNCTRISSATDP